MQETPPVAKSAGRVTQREIRIQHDAVHAIVAAVQKIAVVIAQIIGRHEEEVIPKTTPSSILASLASDFCGSAGAIFSGRSPRKNVGTSARQKGVHQKV